MSGCAQSVRAAGTEAAEAAEVAQALALDGGVLLSRCKAVFVCINKPCPDSVDMDMLHARADCGRHAAGTEAAEAAEVAQALALDGGFSLSRGEAVFVREYESGRLARSDALTAEEVELIGARAQRMQRKPSKRTRRKVCFDVRLHAASSNSKSEQN